MQQGRIAMTHAFGDETALGAFRLLPTGIYTIPEIGMVGATEESLEREGNAVRRRTRALSPPTRAAGLL
jgi:NAD(P) transhydrogenase